MLDLLVMQNLLNRVPRRYRGQKQEWRSAFDSCFDPWWFEASPCGFDSRPVHFLHNVRNDGKEKAAR